MCKALGGYGLVIRLVMMMLLLVGGMGSAFAVGAEKYDYPELTVVPRASDRLKMEADRESDGKWTQFLPIQISGIATLAAGIANMDSASPGQSIYGMSVGAGWLVMTALLATSYHPYSRSFERVAAMPQGTMREQLSRERVAEEEIRAACRAGERIRWLSVLTNLSAAVLMLAKGPNSNFGINHAFAVGSAVLSFAPMFYRFRWNEVHEEQMEYKKKIYGPVSMLPTVLPTVFYQSTTQTYVPGVEATIRF